MLLVVDQNDDPFAERIRAELVGLGLEVVTLEPWRTGEPVESLDGTARAMGATAAVRMVHSRRGEGRQGEGGCAAALHGARAASRVERDHEF